VIGRFGIGSAARAGSDVEMRVDTRRLHFFDLESEQAIESQPGDAGGEKEAVSD
jgi:hypothetical protein